MKYERMVIIMRKAESWLVTIVLFTFICVVVFCGTVVYYKNREKVPDGAGENMAVADGTVNTGYDTSAEGTDNKQNSEENSQGNNSNQGQNENGKKDDSIPSSGDEDVNKTEGNTADADKAEGDKANSTDDVADNTGALNGNTTDDEELTDTGNNGTISICLAGDLMCLSGQQYSALKSDGSYDFTGSFSVISEFIQRHDIAVANLETLLSVSTPVTSERKTLDGEPSCNAPLSYIDAVTAAGFTGLVTANNHCLDGELTGLTETIDVLEGMMTVTGDKLRHSGTYYENSAAEHYMMFEVGSAKIAIVAFTELINQRDCLEAERLEKVIDCYSAEYAAGIISEARAAGADFVIAYTHWGSENTTEIKTAQKEHAVQLANAGADFIAGSHSHCIQKMEMIVSEDGREVPCFYSLGNLVSSMSRDMNNDTVLLSLILKAENGKVAIESISYLPCRVLSVYGSGKNVIVPVAYEVEGKGAAKALSEAEGRIKAILDNVDVTVY